MSYEFPIFAKFKHPELRKVKLDNEEVTERELNEIVKNTNFLIEKGLHVPGYRLTHYGDEDKVKGKSLGWIEKCGIAKDGKMLGYSDFTKNGKELIVNKDVRWVSSGIRRDFSLTGEPDGPVLPGLYLDHVAVLGDELPAVKGLVDLTRIGVDMSEESSSGLEKFTVDEESGEICYFAEIDLRKEMKMPPVAEKEEGTTVTTAMFKEYMKKVDDLTDALSKEKEKSAAAEKELAEFRAKSQESQFSEYKIDLDKDVKSVQKDLGVGAEFAESLTELGQAVFGNKKAEKAFKDHIAKLRVTKKAPNTRIEVERDFNDVDDEADGAMFSADGSNITERHLNEAAYKPEIGQEIAKVIANRQKKDPKFDLKALRKEVIGRRR